MTGSPDLTELTASLTPTSSPLSFPSVLLYGYTGPGRRRQHIST